MAFNQSDLAPVGAISSSAPSVYSYVTTVDSSSTVLASGYFDAKFDEMGDADKVMATCSDGAIIAEITKSGGTLTSTNIISGGGAVNTDDVANLSTATGSTTTQALDFILAATNNKDSDGVTNVSTVAGADVTAALDNLQAGLTPGSNDVTNESTVTGVTVSNALDTLESNMGLLTSGDIENVSSVVGSMVTGALNTLDSDIANLNSNDITNVSGVTGADVTGALNTLSSGLTPNSSLITNDSTVIGATVTLALETLDSGLTPGSDDVTNNSAVSGTTVTNALTTLNAALTPGSDDVTNDSTVVGATTSNALDNLKGYAPATGELVGDTQVLLEQPTGNLGLIPLLTSGVAETFGPTGSGATNIWSDLNVLPAECTGIYLSCRSSLFNGSPGSTQTVRLATNFLAQGEVGSQVRADLTMVSQSGILLDADNISLFWVPINNTDNIFEISYTGTNSSGNSPSITIALLGFMVENDSRA